MNLTKQRGEILIESMIGMVLMALIGGGVSMMTANVARGHGEMNVQSLAIQQMRSALVENGFNSTDICATPPPVSLPNSVSVTLSMQGCTSGARAVTSATIQDVGGTMAAVTVNDVPAPVVIQASSEAFAGNLIVGGAWN